MRHLVAPLAATIAVALCACSSVHSVYLQNGYDPKQSSTVKRITIAAWAPQADTGLGEVLGHVAGDLIMLRKNYLVYQTLVPKQSWAEGCVDKAEGVLLIRTLDSQPHQEDLFLSLVTELYRCSDGALLWRADASSEQRSTNPDLTQMVQNYATSLGAAANRYAAPAFVLLQQLVHAMPDPVLSDADIEEKIQLGRSEQPSEMIATLPQLRQ